MRVVIAADRAVRATALRPAVEGLGLVCGAADCLPYGDLSAEAAVSAGLTLVLLDGTAAGLAAVQQAVLRSRGPVFAAGSSPTPVERDQALRSGAAAYLLRDRLRPELQEAIARQPRGAKPARPGRAYAVVAAGSGVGVTTVATNLAFALAGEQPGNVALAEIGAGVPGVALNLDLRPRHGVADLSEHWERLDATMLRQALVAHPAGLSILAHTPETLRAEAPEPAVVRQTVILLRSVFAAAVLDLGTGLGDGALEAMVLSDQVLFVLRLDVPALRLARRFLRDLTDRGLPRDKVRPLANRSGQRDQVGPRQAEEELGLPIAQSLPDDPPALNRALNLGQPLVSAARRAAVTRSFADLARRLAG
jgi:pilus assembly protein CpaE